MTVLYLLGVCFVFIFIFSFLYFIGHIGFARLVQKVGKTFDSLHASGASTATRRRWIHTDHPGWMSHSLRLGPLNTLWGKGGSINLPSPVSKLKCMCVCACDHGKTWSQRHKRKRKWSLCMFWATFGQHCVAEIKMKVRIWELWTLSRPCWAGLWGYCKLKICYFVSNFLFLTVWSSKWWLN